MVIHDETIDRTTNGTGYVKDYTLKELKKLEIIGVKHENSCYGVSKIPTLKEVFILLKPYCEKKGLLINIELKNSIFRYPNM